MTKSSWVLIALALAIGANAAHAQPGATPPSEPPPNQAPPPPQGDPMAPPGAMAPQGQPAPQLFDPSTWTQDAVFDRLIDASPVLRDIAMGALRRARRSISIGPTVGLFGGYAGGGDVALSFGIGLEKFKVPVLPSMENFKAIIKERAKAKLKQVLAEGLQGRALSQAEMEQLVTQIFTDAVQEVLGLANILPKRMERPSFSFGLEANRYLSLTDTWALRLRLGMGISRLTLGLSTVVGFTDPRVNTYLGPELVAHIMMSKKPRSSVLDVFLRVDIEMRNRGEAYSDDVYTVGLRYLLDII